ncbi:NAD(P)-dependent oxidoreductase [Psychromarinibacter halotolerans]|uniref:NAD(P)-dependent oxidoreductase n=1 Tax=Psychromarinibacter halotolerans TaxID=1775175 RepID=A0ABV7GSK6_9RHOB|nr:NAD(P)-dependent oxidoreductase [Psychromarinibacter halotolerans]MDF0597648.1 NAD(P)-dependent oxidoreductase [Psychromarinibacter halotolerans]
MRTAILLPLSPEQRARLEAADLDLVFLPDEGACPPAFQTARAAFGNPPADWLAQAPDLDWVQLESVGFGEYAGEDLRGATLTNLAGFFAEPAAESILAGLLALYRGIDRLALLRRDGVWTGDDIRPTLRCLQGARVTLFGMGAINARLADMLAPFGCTITALRSGWQPKDLDAALADTDILVATAPDTPATRDVFDARRLSLLPANAIVASFGRGSVLDEAALAAALSDGALSGAVIDVTRDEPLPADHPFWTCPNLILTQHSGGGTGDEIDRKIDLFLANLARFRAGEPLTGVVSFEKGY